MKRLLAALLLCASTAFGQPYYRTTEPFVFVGGLASIPATCTVGQIAFITDATAGQNIYECASTNTWTQQAGGGIGSGDVVGPASAVDNGIVRFDGTTGKLVQGYSSNTPTCGDTGVCTFVAPVLGTPTTLVGTNITGTAAGLTAGTANAVAVGGITGLGAGVATALGTPSSANLASALTDETGTGAAVFANTPTLVTPVIGAATGTSLVLSGNITAANLTPSGTLTNGNLCFYNATTLDCTIAPTAAGRIPNSTSATATAFTATPTLGASGTLGSLTLGNATSGTLTIAPVTGALGTTTLALPAAAGTGRAAQVIAAGTSALGTSAISSGACATVVTTTATGAATTDAFTWVFNADPTATTGYSASANGMLTIIAYPTANNVNFKVCNNTASSVTPGAVTLNWTVVR